MKAKWKILSISIALTGLASSLALFVEYGGLPKQQSLALAVVGFLVVFCGAIWVVLRFADNA